MFLLIWKEFGPHPVSCKITSRFKLIRLRAFVEIWLGGRALDKKVRKLWKSKPHRSQRTEGRFFKARLRPSDMAIERSNVRALERSTERSSDRAIERSSDRAIDRTRDRATERMSDQATERPSDCVIERPSKRWSSKRPSARWSSDRAIDGDRKSSSRSPLDTLTNALYSIFELVVLTRSRCVFAVKNHHTSPICWKLSNQVLML